MSEQTGQAGDDAYREAIPTSETLKLEVPETESDSSRKMLVRAVVTEVGETSKYYLRNRADDQSH